MSTTGKSSETAVLSEWAAAVRFGQLPEAVRHEVQRALLNYLGCALHGAHHPASLIYQAAVEEWAGDGTATVVGTLRKTGMFSAALANALHASVDAFCDTHAQAIIHPSAPVMGAALALAEQRRSDGKSLALAVALGLETACRLSKAVSVNPACGSLGWLQTGIAGGVGAATAAGSLLGLDARQMAAAMGIAASLAGGLRASMGTMTTPLVHAQGAEAGLRAACLAAGGFTGPLDALETEHGYAQMFSALPHLDHLTAGLGELYETLSLTYKAYPCGIVAHPIIDAALRLKAQGVDIARIRSVVAKVHPSAAKLTGRQHPKDGTEAQFSLHHWAAVAMIYGSARIADAEPERLEDPAVEALRSRIEAVPDASIAADAAVLVATLSDERQVTVAVDHCTGSAANPMSDADIEMKFRGLAATDEFGEAALARVIRSCWHLPELEDAADLIFSTVPERPMS